MSVEKKSLVKNAKDPACRERGRASSGTGGANLRGGSDSLQAYSSQVRWMFGKVLGNTPVVIPCQPYQVLKQVQLKFIRSYFMKYFKPISDGTSRGKLWSLFGYQHI